MSTVAAVEQLPTLARNNNTKLAAGDTCIFKPVYTWSEGDGHVWKEHKDGETRKPQTKETCLQPVWEVIERKTVSLIIVKAAQIRAGMSLNNKPDRLSGRCHLLKCECQTAFAEKYHMPRFWWSDHNQNASGYFGCESYDNENEDGSSVVSWLRLQVKVQDDVDNYYWYKINILVDWQPSGATKIILFDPKPQLVEKIEANVLFNIPENRNHLKDPFWVYDQVFEDLIAVQDTSVWQIRDLTRSAEKRKHMAIGGGGNPVTYFDTLHDILRHAIHSTETLQTTVKTINSLISNHEMLRNRVVQAHTEQAQKYRRNLEKAQVTRDSDRRGVQRNSGVGNIVTGPHDEVDVERLEADVEAAELALTNEIAAEKDRRHAYYHSEERFLYYEHFFGSTLGRSMANKERLTNQIQLEFNKVTKTDSEAMKTIAFVTLLFLPATFVAAIFSTSFFNSSGGEWRMSRDLWKYWAFALPITLMTALLWTLWLYRGKIAWWYDQRRGRAEKHTEEKEEKEKSSQPSDRSADQASQGSYPFQVK